MVGIYATNGCTFSTILLTTRIEIIYGDARLCGFE